MESSVKLGTGPIFFYFVQILRVVNLIFGCFVVVNSRSPRHYRLLKDAQIRKKGEKQKEQKRKVKVKAESQ